jgi:hypothetical protein
MAWCSKGHEYDERTNASCPRCAQMGLGGGPAAGQPVAKTLYEDVGGSPAGSGGYAQQPVQPPTPVAPFPGVQNFQRQMQQPAHQPAAMPPIPSAGGQGTVMEDVAEAAVRLMGFLVITSSKKDDEYRYFRLRKGVNFIGRFGSRCQVEIRDDGVSNQHALIICTNKASKIVDLDSGNGTRINGEKTEFAALDEGDVITLGRTDLVHVPFPFVAED